MTPSRQHPIEDVYAAREALERAVSAQMQTDIAAVDWSSYGSALLSLLSTLNSLTETLVNQIDQTDRDELHRRALRDHPHEALDRAVADLNALRTVLNSAITDVRHYWSEAHHIEEDTPGRSGSAE